MSDLLLTVYRLPRCAYFLMRSSYGLRTTDSRFHSKLTASKVSIVRFRLYQVNDRIECDHGHWQLYPSMTAVVWVEPECSDP